MGKSRTCLHHDSKNKLNLGFLLQNKKVALFWPGDARRRSMGCPPPAVTHRWRDREQPASGIDSPDSLNWQLALMSALILMRGFQILVHSFISRVTPPPPCSPRPSPPAVTWSLFGECWVTIRWPSTQSDLICSTQPSPPPLFFN